MRGNIKAVTARRRLHGLLAATLAVSLLGISPAAAQSLDLPPPVGGACGDWTAGYGPLDYRLATPQQIDIVERNHFNASVETLQKGMTSITAGGDLTYTLRAFPNHPRALAAMSRLVRKEGREKPKESMFSMECWYQRAIRFAPDDPSVRVLYGNDLLRAGRRADAIEQLEEATRVASDSANVQYNLGLAYFGLKDYRRSLEHAQKAYAQGFPLPGLREKLKKAGQWRAPPEQPTSQSGDPK
jgi:tetratricopeptide (TPR) repeat protein